MPAFSGPSNGPNAAVSAVPVEFGTLAFLAAGTQNTNVLLNDGLVGVRVWCLQTAGVAVTVQVQFAQGNAAGNVINWQPLIAPFNMPAGGVPVLGAWSLGSSRYRLAVTATGVATFLYRLTGALT